MGCSTSGLCCISANMWYIVINIFTDAQINMETDAASEEMTARRTAYFAFSRIVFIVRD